MGSHLLFIGLKVQTDVETIFGELENYGPLKERMSGIFTASVEDFYSISGLTSKICEWFYARLADPDCKKNQTKIIKLYGQKDFDKILKCYDKSIVNISVFSRMEYYDEPYGASLLEYETATKELTITDKEWEDPDPYGEELYDKYRAINNNIIYDTPKIDKYNWREAVIPEGFEMCPACYGIYPEQDMVIQTVDGEKYKFCKQCSDDFFGSSDEDY